MFGEEEPDFIEGVRGEIWKGYWNDLYTCIIGVKVWEESVMFLEDWERNKLVGWW